jgi:RimJ/RimL family protein N-acetyltransferase
MEYDKGKRETASLFSLETWMSSAARAGDEVVLRTKRLTLAPLHLSYAARIFELLNDWDVSRMLSEVPWPLRYEDVTEFLAKQPDPSVDGFVVLSKGGPIGEAVIKKPGSGDPPRKMPRLGYFLGRRYWRAGYGTEAIGAIVDHAFEKYPAAERVGAGVFHDNPASRGLLEKLGFAAAGVGRCHSCSRGVEVETVDMQVTREAWLAKAAER